MTTDYAGADDFPTTIPLIDDSDAPNAANFDAAPQGLADRTTNLKLHKLTKDGPDTLSGALTVSGTGSIDLQSGATLTLESGASETVHAGATMTVAGALVHSSGSTESGTISGGNVTRSNGTVSLTGSAQIACLTPGAIETGVAGAISIGIAGGITSHAGDGITSATVGGISSGVDAGISFDGSTNDYGNLDPPRPKLFSFPPVPLDPTRLSPNPTLNAWYMGLYGQALIGPGPHQPPLACALVNPHQGATLSQVYVTFAVGSSHSSVPGTLPFLQVFRVSLALGVTPTGDHLSATSTQYFSPTPATGADWYASGQQQALIYNCDQNNVIDNTAYVYIITIGDEAGSGSETSNIFQSITCVYDGITDLRFPC